MRVVNATHRSFTQKNDPVTIVQKLRGLHGRPGQVRKISPSPGFDPRTVRPIACRYTDNVIPAHKIHAVIRKSAIFSNDFPR